MLVSVHVFRVGIRLREVGTISPGLRWYLCCVFVTVENGPPENVLLSSDFIRQYEAYKIRIFSPYYPCYSPAATYTIECSVVPQR